MKFSGKIIFPYNKLEQDFLDLNRDGVSCLYSLYRHREAQLPGMVSWLVVSLLPVDTLPIRVALDNEIFPWLHLST